MEFKKITNPDTVIIYVSFILFVFRLYACRHLFPGLYGMDYYGYIELAKNIFHKLDFTVRWEVDSPFQYPPFFSILIYLLTYLTKNFITSIQYISIFCTSFYLVPLFSLVRNMLNVQLAVLAVIFSTYYFGIKPCYQLNMDFFYSFLIIIICWLVLDTLTHRSHMLGRYVLAGFLISVADLTKYSGIFFGLASAASILYYFARYQQSLKTGFKYCAFLLLGAVPLFITYHLLLDINSQKGVPSIGARVFFDGNYMFDNGLDNREEKISELNREGTEFAFVSFLKTNNILDYSLKNPSYVFNKYVWGLNKISQDMTFSVLPVGTIPDSRFYKISPDGDKVFNALIGNDYDGSLIEVSQIEAQVNPDIYLKKDTVREAAGDEFGKVWDILQQSLRLRMGINIMFQGAFLFLLIISGRYLKWDFKMMHILLFTIGMLLIPFCSPDERYLMPFMPLYFVLWLFILYSLYTIIKTEIIDKISLRNVVLILSVCLVSVYTVTSYKQIDLCCRYFKKQVRQNEIWLKAAFWIKQDSVGYPKRAKIMAFSNNYLSYLTDSDYIRLPFMISNWNKVINFAVLKKVDYIVIGGDYVAYFLTFSEHELGKPASPDRRSGRIKMLHMIKVDNNTVLVVKLGLVTN